MAGLFYFARVGYFSICGEADTSVTFAFRSSQQYSRLYLIANCCVGKKVDRFI